MFFKGVNELDFDEIKNEKKSKEKKIKDVEKKVQIEIGVEIEGGIMEIRKMMRGEKMELVDLNIGLFVVECVQVMDLLWFERIEKDEGKEMEKKRVIRNNGKKVKKEQWIEFGV